MKNLYLSLFVLLSNAFYSQILDYKKAPNSYIYDINLANENNYSGLEFPVTKAYEMWSGYEYLKTGGISTPIPEGSQSVTLYWEDVPGLIKSVGIVPNDDFTQSKIVVDINKGKGKGNAVIAFKVNGTIYWSWHIWVTDNPENGVNYQYWIEKDIDGNPITIQYMDRNLGAASGNFLGNQWDKSGGLMYEWGRKDPFPPLVFKDQKFYEISGEVGNLKHKQVDPVNTIPVQQRLFDDIGNNMRYSVNNPITYIINTDSGGNWFSKDRYKVAAPSPNYITWDLWSDNAKGGNSNGNSSNTTLKNESLSYELKSELDPCPNGWRIPSYLGRVTQNNNLAFFGKHDWNNDDNVVANRQIFPNSVNPSLNGIKVYPGLGMDFTNAQNGARNLGIVPVSGGYVYYPNSSAPTAPIGITFQDNIANGGLWSATYAYDGARIFSMISDPFRTNTNVGLHAVFINETNPTKAGNAVKCMRDPNLIKIGDFPTQYVRSYEEDYTEGLDQPNSYIVIDQNQLEIPVNKAFSIYNQLLSNHEMLPYENLVAKVFWTSNPSLITDVQVNKNVKDQRKSTILLGIRPDQKGNAVISLHNQTTNNPVLWSWHIWAPESDPTTNTITYTTESTIATSYNFINPSKSQFQPLQTTFMDRNLGAQSSDILSGAANGLHYQWGRKDPLPNFLGEGNDLVYLPRSENELEGTIPVSIPAKMINSREITSRDYLSDFTVSFENYHSQNPENYMKIQENTLYSVRNPLHFLYQNSLGNIYNGGNHYANDLSKIKDWVSDKRAIADNRWGHADKKSPFDPCPEGWRVPDVSFTNLYTGSKGTSPWYNGYQNDIYGKSGIIQDQWHNVSTYYGGTLIPNKGWKFESTNYPIGVFPSDGMRGELGGDKLSSDRSGVWTASLADLQTGFALAMQFQEDKMQTGTGVYPQAAMSVRCAKDENRLLGTPIAKKPKPILIAEKKEQIILPNEIQSIKIFPNPFKEQFTVNKSNATNFEIYDLSGKLVLKGAIRDGKVNAGSLLNGIYLIKIILNDGTSVTKKLIKS